MWDLLYPSNCLHCQTHLIRDRVFDIKAPLFCPECLQLMQVEQKAGNKVWIQTKRWRAYPVFDVNSPFFSLYKKQHTHEPLPKLMASFLTLSMGQQLFEKESSIYFAALLKEKALRIKTSALYLLYTAFKTHFYSDVNLIWPKMGFFSSGYLGFHSEGSSAQTKAVLVIEQLKKPMQNALEKSALFLKKERGISHVDVYVLFS